MAYRSLFCSLLLPIVDLTVKYELIIPGGVKLEPLPLHRPEILPGASHTFQLGPIGVDLILIGDDGESKHVAYVRLCRL
jgi:hypothetical protein